jgi:hypothetical protein
MATDSVETRSLFKKSPWTLLLKTLERTELLRLELNLVEIVPKDMTACLVRTQSEDIVARDFPTI